MKLSKLFLPIFLLLTVFLSSSCFDILEEITINRDGSGNIVFKVDMGELAGFMEGLAEGGEEEIDMGELDGMFEDEEMVMGLESMAGIHNVKNLSDKETYIFGFSCDFDEVEDLNNLLGESNFLGAIFEGEAGGDVDPDKARKLTLKGKKLTLSGDYKVDTEMEGEDEMQQAMMMQILGEANYKTVYHFEQDVKKVKKNERAIVGADGKSVVIEASLAELMQGDADLNGQIKLR